MRDLSDIRSISMLDEQTLHLLSIMAAESSAGILEIGPYIGGSSIAIAIGNKGRWPHVAIECGGSAPDHPRLPSRDILSDLKANLIRFGVDKHVTICPGSSYQKSVRANAIRSCGNEIGLLFVDADGNIGPTVRAFAPYLKDDCLLAIDDYVAPEAKEKELVVRPWIDKHIEAGRITKIDINGSTWFGKLSGKDAREWIKDYDNLFAHDHGHAFKKYFDPPFLSDSLDDPHRSKLVLYEDGHQIGPAHAVHADIREKGLGRYSHWNWTDKIEHNGFLSCLYFSASDNSDPNTNGRLYSMRIDGQLVPLF